MIGSTGSSALWALLTSLALVCVLDILRNKQKKDLINIQRKKRLASTQSY